MIIVECDKDQALVYRMGFTPDQVEHQLGRSKVLGRVEQEREAGRKVVGIVDEDPQASRPEYLKEYDRKGAIGSIELLKRRDDDGNTVVCRAIQISPRLEDWLYKVARRRKIAPERFYLPSDPEELHSMSLRLGKNRENFQRFLDALRNTKDDEVNTLREWIKEAIG